MELLSEDEEELESDVGESEQENVTPASDAAAAVAAEEAMMEMTEDGPYRVVL